MNIATLLQQMREDGNIVRIARNPLAQFGTRTRRYLGALYLPERTVPNNEFTEEGIRYRTIIASGTTRYAPVTLKQGAYVGTFRVTLGESDTGSELTSQEYDVLKRALNRNDSMAAMHQLTRFLDTTVNIPLVEFNERQRWQVLVDAQAQIRGANEYKEDIAYPNPVGHRVAAAHAWTDDPLDPYDPYEDILAMARFLRGKGLEIIAIVTSTDVEAKLLGNAAVRMRTGAVVIGTAGSIQTAFGQATTEDLNRINRQNGLPAFTRYDLMYQTNTGSGYFLKRDVMVFICATGRDETIDLGEFNPAVENVLTLENTLGYVAIGTPAGQSEPGRVIISTPYENKPPRIENEGWQTSLVILMDPECVGVIHSIT